MQTRTTHSRPVRLAARLASLNSPWRHGLTRAQANPRRAAFSLIELLTAVSIMMVIIYALYAMFNQTQKALRANITQVDVLESGRAASEMMGRELEQIGACNLGQTINVTAQTRLPPLTQLDLEPSRDPLRTNVLQEFFFMSRQANKWVGTGYRVLEADDGVGTLYRFTVSTNYRGLNFTNLSGQFEHARLTTNSASGLLSTNFNRVADGVIHLRLTPYDHEGRRLGWETTNDIPFYRMLRLNRNGQRIGLTSTAANAYDAQVILQGALIPRETQFSFVSNALPAYLELELGVLEPGALKQYQSLRDSPKTANAYLQKQAAKVHLFRQRIPIRTALQ